MTGQRGRRMDKENEHFGYRNVSWVQSSLRDQCSTAHQGWILGRSCKSVSQCFPLAQGCDGLQLGWCMAAKHRTAADGANLCDN